jgi:hypothetical protein
MSFVETVFISSQKMNLCLIVSLITLAQLNCCCWSLLYIDNIRKMVNLQHSKKIVGILLYF